MMSVHFLNKDFFQENESLRAFFCVAGKTKNIHSHEFWELAYVYEGRGKHHTDTTESVKEGNFFLIKPGAKHSLTSLPDNDGSPMRVCNCIFTQEYFKTIEKEYASVPELQSYALYDKILSGAPFCIRLSDDNARNIRHLMWLTAHEYNHFTIGSEMIMRHSILDLLICITRLYEYSIKRAAPSVSKNAEIDELMKYMRSNFSYKLTLEFLAEHVHLSREYLSRYFKQYTGKNISEFLLEIRMSRAKEMLRTSSYSVADIGIYCGYSSVNNFRKAFKSFVGIPPSTYRNDHKSKKDERAEK